MKDNNGKVILSLLAGATAGVVAGLLLAPETGTETRSGIKKSATKWGDELSKLLKDSLASIQAQSAKSGVGTAGASESGRGAADDVLSSMTQDNGANASAAPEERVNPEASGSSEFSDDAKQNAKA